MQKMIKYFFCRFFLFNIGMADEIADYFQQYHYLQQMCLAEWNGYEQRWYDVVESINDAGEVITVIDGDIWLWKMGRTAT